MIYYYEDIIQELENKIKSQHLKNIKKRSLKRKAERLLDDVLSEDCESSERSINNIRPETGFSQMSEGYSTEESEMEDLKEKKAEIEQMMAE